MVQLPMISIPRKTTIAYDSDKGSILFQVAATHSTIAASQNRSNPEDLIRAFYYFRTCAGVLSYLNENFLHRPSSDLSQELATFLVNLMLAQATEVFFERCTHEKKGNTLIAKIASQTAFMYTSLNEDVKFLFCEGIVDRNWVTVILVKTKFYTSLSQYYSGLADGAAEKHRVALVRYNRAEALAKEASRSASTLASTFVSTMSPNLPSDAGTSLQYRTKAHQILCSKRTAEAQREHHPIHFPIPEAPPVVERLAVVTLIPINDIYGASDVMEVIGQDSLGKSSSPQHQQSYGNGMNSVYSSSSSPSYSQQSPQNGHSANGNSHNSSPASPSPPSPHTHQTSNPPHPPTNDHLSAPSQPTPSNNPNPTDPGTYSSASQSSNQSQPSYDWKHYQHGLTLLPPLYSLSERQTAPPPQQHKSLPPIPPSISYQHGNPAPPPLPQRRQKPRQ